MSITVLPSRNNDNWVANAVVNFVGPLIGDWIKSEREKEINRKHNAAIYEASRILGLDGNDYPNMPTPMNNNNGNGGLLGGLNNGWQNAFRNMNDNPLATFDNNTADIAPMANANISASPSQRQQHIPTPAEFLQAMANVVGADPKRFGLVNLENLQKLSAPMLAAYQADLSRQERQALADKYSNASDLAAKRDVLMGGAINGTVPYDAANIANQWYQFDNPHLIPGSYNAGNEAYFYGYNPRTGEYNFNTQVNNSLSPQQIEEGRRWDKTYALQERQQNFNEEQARWIRENPELKPAYGKDGSLYYVNPYTGEAVYSQTPDGEIVRVDPDSYSKRNTTTSKSSNWTAIDTQRLNALKDEKKTLENRRKEIIRQRDNDIQNEETRKKYNDKIAEIEEQINAKQKEINDYINNKNSQNNNYVIPAPTDSGVGVDFGADSIGGANKGDVSTKFNATRKRADGSTYNHKGTDYPAPEGTPIKLTYGHSRMTVVKVANNPGGYGNYVDLRGQIKDENGQSHTVDIRYAHMKDGSIKVKEGDVLAYGSVIGGVGNTGNSIGKNGGYHLHVETRIDGELVDPQDFNNRLVSFIPKKGNRKGKTEAEREAIQKAQDDTFKNANVFFRNSRTGETISQYQFEEMLRQADEGKLRRAWDLFGPPTIRTPEQLLDFIKSEGYDENFIPDNYQYKSNIYYHNPITHSAMTYDDYKKALRAYQHENKNATEEDFIAYLKSIGNERYNNKNDYQVLPPAINNDNGKNYMAQSGNETDYNTQNGNPSQNVGLTHRLTDEEKERIATQGSTGNDIARVPENQNEAVLNGEKSQNNKYAGDEYNSEVMWTHPNGSTITKSEYNNRLKNSGMENPDYDAWLEAEGYRKADNSNSPAPVGTDYVNGTTPQHNQAQIDYLNGDEVRYGTTFMGEDLPGLQSNGAMAASLTPMGLTGRRNNFRTISEGNNNRNPLNPVFDFLSQSPAISQAVRDKYPDDNYNPYDVNADTGQPYDDNDVYERGFEYDNDKQVFGLDEAQNDFVNMSDNSKSEYLSRPKNLIHEPNYEEFLPPVGQKGRYNLRVLPPVGQNYPQNVNETENQNNLPQQTQQPKQTQPQRNNQPTKRNSVIYPKREKRSPGKIKTNTSYENLKPIVDNAARKHGVDTALVRAIIQVESQWDSNARSAVGAKGLMQLMPGTARGLGVRDAYDVTQNIEGGTKYIAQLIRQFNGDINKALMAYNWGPTYVKKGKNPPSRVQNYANKVMAIYNRLKGRKTR